MRQTWIPTARFVILIGSFCFLASCAVRFLWMGRYITFGSPALYCANPEFDFGVAKSGDVIRHLFRLTNRGTADLELSRIKTDCGCTEVVASAAIVPPGGQTDITANLSLLGLKGDIMKRVLLETNDTRRPLSILVFRGHVEADICVSPSIVSLPVGDDSNDFASTSQSIDVFCNDETTFDITDAYSAIPEIEVKYDTITAGKHYRLSISSHVRVAPLSRKSPGIIVQTNHIRESVLVIPVAFEAGE